MKALSREQPADISPQHIEPQWVYSVDLDFTKKNTLEIEEDHFEMEGKSRFLSSCFLAAALACSVLGAGCAHHYYRVYDPYYSDYHVWNGEEVGYYHTWARENHVDEHRDFRKLPAEQQKAYWNWRHSHGDHH